MHEFVQSNECQAISALRAKDAPAAPDLASLQADLAKLRAVAEAAALVCRDGGDFAEMQCALEHAGYTMVGGWRSAP